MVRLMVRFWSVMSLCLVLAAHGQTLSPAECKQLQQGLANLSKQLTAAQEKSQRSPLCDGPARYNCVQSVKNIQQQLSTETITYNKECFNGGYQGVTTSGTLPYYVVSLIYAPPGNQTTVTYSNGSSTGSETELTHTRKDGIALKVSTPISEVDGSYLWGSEDGSSTEVKKSVGTVVTLQTRVDEIDHGQDMFLLWVSPKLTITGTGPDTATYVFTTQRGQVEVVSVLAHELMNPATMTDTNKKALSQLKSSDFQALLQFDPFLSGGFRAGSRYQKVSQFSVQGPASQTDPLSGVGIEIDNEDSLGNITGHVTQQDMTVVLGPSFDGYGIQAGYTGEIDYENKKNVTSGSAQSATLIPMSTTVGYTAQYQAYWDTLFNSFAFERIGGPFLYTGGTMRDRFGKPLAGKVVVARFGSTKQMAVTDQSGRYRLALPAGFQGALTLKAVNVTTSASLQGKPIALDLVR